MILARCKGLCLNCLRKGNFAGQCQSTFQCKHCQQLHHTLLHKSIEDKEEVGLSSGGDPVVKEQATVNVVSKSPD